MGKLTKINQTMRFFAYIVAAIAATTSAIELETETELNIPAGYVAGNDKAADVAVWDQVAKLKVTPDDEMARYWCLVQIYGNNGPSKPKKVKANVQRAELEELHALEKRDYEDGKGSKKLNPTERKRYNELAEKNGDYYENFNYFLSIRKGMVK